MNEHRSVSVGSHEHTEGSRPILPIPGPEDREIRVTVKCVRMSEEMISYAAVTAEQALKQNATRKDVAAFVKKRFDEKYGPLWHCIVGRDFGSYITHQEQGFIVFRVDDWAFLLFATRQ
ncbi:unnamed protein product [Hymenolepis diminuta]|uniref:Dynein light chain n=2 Tax=Hymenolepis diminuta TaxID=6216 RepID=A0A0R3SUJ1_HYMDI|nr:unnamed protein product [Hymenolepis diminuta]